MRRSTILVSAVFALASGGLAVAKAPGVLKGAELSAQASVTLATARATALKARPGKITDQEL